MCSLSIGGGLVRSAAGGSQWIQTELGHYSPDVAITPPPDWTFDFNKEAAETVEVQTAAKMILKDQLLLW